MKSLSPESQRGFTLIELLVTMSIVGVLSTTAIITLNPAELIAQSRDSVRIADLSTINSALGIYQTDVTGGTFGDANTVYVSLPDSSADCSNQSPALPALTDPWVYHCVSTSTLRNADGTGWIPVNFSQISFGNPLPSLPIDPTNIAGGCGSYYTYTPTWELTSAMASTKYSTSLGTVHTAGPIQGATPAAVTGRCGEGGGGGGGAGGTYAWIPNLELLPTRPADITGPNGYGDYNGTTLEVFIMVLDADNVGVTGATIECSATGSGNHWYGPFNSPTGSDGVASCNVGTSEVGSKSVTITVTLPAGGGTFTVHPTDIATHTTETPAVFTASETADQSTVEVTPTSLPADGYAQAVLTLTARDALGDPVPYAATGCNGENLNSPPDYTYSDADGFYRFGDGQLTGVDGKIICRMSSDVVRYVQEGAAFVGIRPNNPPATTTIIDATPYDIREGGYVVNFTAPGGTASTTVTVDTVTTSTDHYITGTVSIIDSLGNPVPHVPVDCTATGVIYAIQELVSETDDSGLLQCQFFGEEGGGAATIGATVATYLGGGRALDSVLVDYTIP